MFPYHPPLAIMKGENQPPPKDWHRIFPLPQSHHDRHSHRTHISRPRQRLLNLGRLLAITRSMHRRIDAS